MSPVRAGAGEDEVDHPVCCNSGDAVRSVSPGAVGVALHAILSWVFLRFYARCIPKAVTGAVPPNTSQQGLIPYFAELSRTVLLRFTMTH